MFSRGYRSEILLQNGLEKTKGKKTNKMLSLKVKMPLHFIREKSI